MSALKLFSRRVAKRIRFIKTRTQHNMNNVEVWMAAAEIISLVGITLIFIGVLIVILAFLLGSIRSGRKVKARGGGAVIIGPIPIVFGTDKKMVKTMLVLAIVLTVLVLAVTVVNFLLAR